MMLIVTIDRYYLDLNHLNLESIRTLPEALWSPWVGKVFLCRTASRMVTKGDILAREPRSIRSADCCNCYPRHWPPMDHWPWYLGSIWVPGVTNGSGFGRARLAGSWLPNIGGSALKIAASYYKAQRCTQSFPIVFVDIQLLLVLVAKYFKQVHQVPSASFGRMIEYIEKYWVYWVKVINIGKPTEIHPEKRLQPRVRPSVAPSSGAASLRHQSVGDPGKNTLVGCLP